MAATIKRQRFSTKKWSTIFTEKVDEIKERKQKHDDTVDKMEVMMSQVAVVDMMDFSIKTAYRNTLERHGKQNIDNLPAPPRQKDWDPALGMQLLCDLCNIPALNNSILCKKCNIVCHTHCLNKIKATGRKLFQGHPTLENWQCPHCEESLVADLTYYNNMVTKLREERMHNLCAAMIAKRMMIFLERKKLVTKMKAIVKLQSVFRRKLIRTKFMSWRKNILRLVILEITSLPSKLLLENYSANGASPMVIVTVHDTFKNIQLFRFDRTIAETFSDAFFIPGITAHMSIFITIALKEEIYEYSMVGQCQLALRDIVQIDASKPFVLNFIDKVAWPPQDLKNAIFTYKLNPMPPNSQYKDYFLLNRLGTGHAGHYTAPSTAMNNTMTITSSQSASNTFITNPRAEGTTTTTTTTNNSSVTSGLNLTQPIAASTTKNDCCVNYLPQNNTSSMCRMVQGPPLDILRRAADNSKKIGKNTITLPGSGNNQPANYRNSRYWICLYKLKLMFFQYFGDIVPRFIADISDVVAKVERDKGRTTSLVNLIHPDSRVWLLEFQTKQDACKFEFAVNESRKAKNEAKGSKFLNTNDFYTPDMSFGFNIVRERE